MKAARISFLTGALLALTTMAVAQASISFNGLAYVAQVPDTCNDAGCLFLEVGKGTSGGFPTAYIVYDMSWSQGSVNYSLFGAGQVPAFSVQFAGTNKVSVNVSTVNFYGSLCSYDTSTGQEVCTSPDAQVTVTLTNNGMLIQRGCGSSTYTFGGSTLRLMNVTSNASASGSVSITPGAGGTQSFSNAGGTIGTGLNVIVAVTPGGPADG